MKRILTGSHYLSCAGAGFASAPGIERNDYDPQHKAFPVAQATDTVIGIDFPYQAFPGAGAPELSRAGLPPIPTTSAT